MDFKNHWFFLKKSVSLFWKYIHVWYVNGGKGKSFLTVYYYVYMHKVYYYIYIYIHIVYKYIYTHIVKKKDWSVYSTMSVSQKEQKGQNSLAE